MAGRWAPLIARVPRGGALTWLLGVVLTLLTWRVAFGPPGAGIDLSWHAGLAMATDQGLHYGPDVVFTYGPLGFLSLPGMWYEGLSVLAFCYEAVLAIVFAVALVWALRRTLSTGPAVLIALLVLAFLPKIEQPVALAVIVSMGILDREEGPLGLTAFIVAGASLAAIETLIKISLGPLIFAVVLIALIGARARRWQLAGFGGLAVIELLLFWLASGQNLSDLPDFAANSWQVISGYNDAMGVSGLASVFYLAALAPFGVVVGGFFGSYRDARARWAAVALLAVATFALFKEGVVRFDSAHLALYISTACVFWLAIPWPVGLRWLLISGAAVLGLTTVHVLPPAGGELDPIGNLRLAGEQFRTVFSHGRRAELEQISRQGLKHTYRLDRETLAELQGHSVTVDPWEIGVAWAYDLDWEPLPVFQNYSAYTHELDQLNADAVADPDGAERILRENPAFISGGPAVRSVDGRYPGWDPPAQALATICHFTTLRTTPRWQVLGRARDRCSPERPAGTVDSSFGSTVRVPAPRPDEVVLARISGVDVEGLERLRAMMLRPSPRYAALEDGRIYRLVPGTAEDGLMLRAGERLGRERGPFSEVPQAETIALTGVDGDLRFEFFRIRVRGTDRERRATAVESPRERQAVARDRQAGGEAGR